MNSGNYYVKNAAKENPNLTRNEDKNVAAHRELMINTNNNLNHFQTANSKTDEIYKTVKNKNFQDLKLNDYNFFEPFSSNVNNNLKTNTNLNSLGNTNFSNVKQFSNISFLSPNDHISNNHQTKGNLNLANAQNQVQSSNNINRSNNFYNTLKISTQSLSNLDLKIMNENNIEILADSKNERNPNSNVFSSHSNQNNMESDSFNIYSNSSNNTNNAFVSNSSANNMNSTHPASNHSNNNNNSNLILENLSTEELKIHLENAKRIYEKKLLDTEQLIKEINNKDTRISELTSELKGLLETELELENTVANYNLIPENEEIQKSNVKNINTSNPNNNKIDYLESNNSNTNNVNNDDCNQRVNCKKKEINELNLEIKNIKRNHLDSIKQIEKEYDKELESNINKLKENYEKKINEVSEEQDNKIRELQQEIYLIKNKIDKYENIYMNKFNSNNSQQFNTLYNSCSANFNYNNVNNHQNENSFVLNQPNQYLFNLKKEHDEELLEYEKEIERLENIIKENLKITSEADNSNFLNFANIPYYNQNTMENYDIISMISQLETPTNTVHTNERFNFKNINGNNYTNSNAFGKLNNNHKKNQNNFYFNNTNNKYINYQINNNNYNNDNLQETEIIDYSKPAKKTAFDYNQMIDNHNLLEDLKTPKNHEKMKYSTIQQKKKIKHLNNLSVDEDFGEDYWICDEVQINKINNLKMENTIKDRISLRSSNPDF